MARAERLMSLAALVALIDRAQVASLQAHGYGGSAAVRAKLGVALSYLRLATNNRAEWAFRRNVLAARDAFRCAMQLNCEAKRWATEG